MMTPKSPSSCLGTDMEKPKTVALVAGTGNGLEKFGTHFKTKGFS